MLALGDEFLFKPFEMPPDTIGSESKARWVEQPLISTRPIHQFLGIDTESWEVRGHVFPVYASDNWIKRLRELSANGVTFGMVSGSGEIVQGLFAIKSVKGTGTLLTDLGSPRKMEFEVTLVRVGGPNG